MTYHSAYSRLGWKRILQALIILPLWLMLGSCGSPSGDIDNTTGSVDSNKKFRWKMVTTWPANFPIFQEGAEKFTNDVRVMSRGRLDIHVYAGGELVPPLQVFDAVSQGAAEMGHGSPYYWAGKVPEAQFFSSVPFGMTARGMNAWLYYGGGLDLWREVYAPYSVIPFPMGNTGIQMGGWFNKKIASMEDIQGLRMRIPGLGGKVLERAGGNPVLMAGSEIYTALERGIIDATEWVGPFHDLRLGLNRAAKYYYYPGWHEPGTMFELIVNQDKWNELPEDLQRIIEIAAAAISERIYAQMEYNNQVALVEIRAIKNIELLEFPRDVLDELKRLTKITLDEEAAANPAFQKVYEAYSSFNENYSDWSELTEESYQRAIRE
jgi:TRAP-type mannitol/chloroaromatic compound transport system substrate-binding protein